MSSVRDLSILVVEDNFDVNALIVRAVKPYAKDIFIAYNGIEGLDLYAKHEIDVILTDFDMPVMNGLLMIKNIRETYEHTKIFLVTGIHDMDMIAKAVELNINYLIKKPIELRKIFEKLEDIIKIKDLEKKIEYKTKLLEQYKKAVDKSSIVSKADKNWIITYVNDKFCKVSGYTENELIGANHNIIRHPDMEHEVFQNMWFTLKDLKSTWSGILKNKTKDGSLYWVKTDILPILDENKEIIEFIAIRTDISEQIYIEQYFENKLSVTSKTLDEMMFLNDQYTKVIDKSNAFSRTDISGEITYVNDKFLSLSGYSRDELIGKTHSVIKHEDTPREVYIALWSKIKKGETWTGLIKNKTKDGTACWFDTTIVPITNIHGEITEYMSIRHDLTEIFDLHTELDTTQKEIVYRMGELAETRSKETGNHVKRVAKYSKLLAILYGLSSNEAECLFAASPMHDIGKLGIPDSILKKEGSLNKEEWEIMKSHSQIGYDILKGSPREVLQAAAIVSYEHHEKYDGTGYPRGLKGEEIHVYGRITAVADVFDALGSDRCYKKAWDDDEIFEFFEKQKGKQFDPNLVDIFFEHFSEFDKIRKKFN